MPRFVDKCLLAAAAGVVFALFLEERKRWNAQAERSRKLEEYVRKAQRQRKLEEDAHKAQRKLQEDIDLAHTYIRYLRKKIGAIGDRVIACGDIRVVIEKINKISDQLIVEHTTHNHERVLLLHESNSLPNENDSLPNENNSITRGCGLHSVCIDGPTKVRL